MTNKIRIAVIGGGLSGLSAAWHLLQNDDIQVDLFDPAGIGGGASGMAAGLLHRYAGRFARTNWMGQEGYDATRVLIDVAEEALGQPVAEKSGFLRVALTEENLKAYAACAEKNEDVDWLTAEETVKRVPGIVSAPSILIKSAFMIHGEAYLQGLWLACQKRGGQLHRIKVDKLSDLDDYDMIVVTTGAYAQELHSLTVTPVKGQLLELEWPSHIPPLPLPIGNQSYIVMSPDKKSCLAGATFEHQFDTPEPVLEVAVREIMPKVESIYPQLRGAKILNCRAGIRASTPDHKPILKEVEKNCWVLVGMGSKGLLYHGLFGQLLADKIV